MDTLLQRLARRRNWNIGQVKMATQRLEALYEELFGVKTQKFIAVREDYIYWIKNNYEQDKIKLLKPEVSFPPNKPIWSKP